MAERENVSTGKATAPFFFNFVGALLGYVVVQDGKYCPSVILAATRRCLPKGRAKIHLAIGAICGCNNVVKTG